MGNNSHKYKLNNEIVKEIFNRANWMSTNQDKLKDIQIKNLRLIGSHNSGSYSISMIGDSYSVCQNISIYYQLYGGVRYLDLRVGNYKDKIKLGHEIHYGYDSIEALKEIAEFLKDYPKEILIIKIRAENILKDNQKENLINSIEELFGNVLVNKEDKWFDFETCTPGLLWQNNKNIILYYDDKLTMFGDLDRIYFENKGFWSLKRLYDPWPQTHSLTKMVERNEFHLKLAQDGEVYERHLFVLQFILTPSIKNFSFTKTLAKKIFDKKALENFLEAFSQNRFNIILFDFVFGLDVGSQFYLIDNIINSNFYDK
jgi:hypothetical protein